MAQPLPSGVDPVLWNLALLITQIQAIQTQATPVTPQQIAALQSAIQASPVITPTATAPVTTTEA